MGIWSRLFRGRATPEQRLARAREHLTGDEYEQAVRVLVGLDGDDVTAVRTDALERIRARDERAERAAAAEAMRTRRRQVEVDGAEEVSFDEEPQQERASFDDEAGVAYEGTGNRESSPIVFHPQAVDGSLTIEVGGQRVTFNAPHSDDDGKPRAADGHDVARRLLIALCERELEVPAFPFVDSTMLLARAGESLPMMTDPQRRALATLVVAAAAHDAARVAEAVRAAPPSDLLGIYAVSVAAPFALRELVALVSDDRVSANAMLLRRLAPVDPTACAALIERTGDAALAASFSGQAVLAAEDAGADAGPLAARWQRWEDLTDRDARHTWLAFEVRRLARRDLGAALALEPRLAEDWVRDDDATLAVAARLARADAPRALALARERGCATDYLPWLSGCALGGAPGAGDLVDEWIAAFGPHQYDPYAYFCGVLEACFALRDVERTRALLAAAGATGWQVAHAGRWALSEAARRGDVSALLAACLERYPAGIVAGRAGERGLPMFGAGRMVLRPAWLELGDPHPIETLSIVAALGADGPTWNDSSLP